MELDRWEEGQWQRVAGEEVTRGKGGERKSGCVEGGGEKGEGRRWGVGKGVAGKGGEGREGGGGITRSLPCTDETAPSVLDCPSRGICVCRWIKGVE